MSPAPVPMLQALDEAPINRRLPDGGRVMVGAMLDLFDFFLIAFVVPILNDEWGLTFGEATAMLLSGGFRGDRRQHRLGPARRPPTAGGAR